MRAPHYNAGASRYSDIVSPVTVGIRLGILGKIHVGILYIAQHSIGRSALLLKDESLLFLTSRSTNPTLSVLWITGVKIPLIAFEKFIVIWRIPLFFSYVKIFFVKKQKKLYMFSVVNLKIKMPTLHFMPGMDILFLENFYIYKQ